MNAPLVSTRFSAMQNGHGSWGVYDHRLGDWLRMFVGSYDLAQEFIARIEGDHEAEPDEYPMHEREASWADQTNDEIRDGVR